MCEFLVTFSDFFLVCVIFWRVVAYLKQVWYSSLTDVSNFLRLQILFVWQTCVAYIMSRKYAILHTHACNSGLNWHTVMWWPSDVKFCNHFVWFLGVLFSPKVVCTFVMHWHLCIQILFWSRCYGIYPALYNWTQQIWSPCLIYFEFAWRFILSWAPICNTRNFVIFISLCSKAKGCIWEGFIFGSTLWASSIFSSCKKFILIQTVSKSAKGNIE